MLFTKSYQNLSMYDEVTASEIWRFFETRMGRGADLHMAQLMPLPPTLSCFSKIKIGLPFWYRLTWVFQDKGPLNGCCC